MLLSNLAKSNSNFKKGATSYMEPTTESDDHGSIVISGIKAPGGDVREKIKKYYQNPNEMYRKSVRVLNLIYLILNFLLWYYHVFECQICVRSVSCLSSMGLTMELSCPASSLGPCFYFFSFLFFSALLLLKNQRSSWPKNSLTHF